MTYKEIVYFVLDSLKLVSDDSHFTEAHVLFLADKMRAMLLKQRYSDIRKEIPESNYQTICVPVERTDAIDGKPCTGADYLKSVLKGYKGAIYTIDARKISMEALGKYFPNTPMLAAIVKVANIMSDEAFLSDMQGSFKHKFAKKPEVIEGNMKALELALKEVQKIQ